MADRDNLTLKSRLPGDPAYWDDLAGRIAARSAPHIDDFGSRRAPWWGWLADFSPALAGAAVLALVGSWILAPSAADADPDAVLPVVGQAIVPDDPIARALAADSLPPSLAGLAWGEINDGESR